MTNDTRTRTTPRQRLERSNDDRVLAGVAGGLGDHLGIGAGWIRLAFIILAFFGGFGVIAYLACWILIPQAGQRDPIIGDWLSRLDTADVGVILGVVLIGAAALFVLTQWADVSATVILAAVLFVVGLLLYRGDIGGGSRRRPGGGGTTATDVDDVPDALDDAPAREGDTDEPIADTSVTATLVADGDGGSPTVPDAPAPPEASPKPPRPPKERSVLGRLTLAVALIAVAAMAMVDIAMPSLDIQPVQYIATGVAILGVGLVVGAWIGRAKWLIAVGVLVLPVLWFTALWPSGFEWTAGQVDYSPTVAMEVDSPYDLGFGQMTLDLRGLTADELRASGLDRIEASVGMGQMIVIVPPDVDVTVDASVGFGTVEGPFPDANGIGIDITRTVPTGGAENAPQLTLSLEVGAGVIEVRHSGLIFIDGLAVPDPIPNVDAIVPVLERSAP